MKKHPRVTMTEIIKALPEGKYKQELIRKKIYPSILHALICDIKDDSADTNYLKMPEREHE